MRESGACFILANFTQKRRGSITYALLTPQNPKGESCASVEGWDHGINGTNFRTNIPYNHFFERWFTPGTHLEVIWTRPPPPPPDHSQRKNNALLLGGGEQVSEVDSDDSTN
jgi:hypothetical protein